MFEVRIHGRGGQGVVTTAELLSVAAFRSGRHAQAFPSFGSERTGAPVMAFCRIDEQPIRLREPVLRPDLLIVQDSTLLRVVDVFAGLVPHGVALLNTQLDWHALGIEGIARERVMLVPASGLAIAHLGRPMPGAGLLGGFAAISGGLVSLEAVHTAIGERFSGRIAEGNVATATAAYEFVRAAMRESSHA
jgi:pyruvate ferredoxin oxidoreductase gamma subunit